MFKYDPYIKYEKSFFGIVEISRCGNIIRIKLFGFYIYKKIGNANWLFGIKWCSK